MATKLDDLVKAYIEALKKKQELYHGRFDDSVIEGLALQSLPEELRTDEYTRLEFVVGEFWHFKLKDMTSKTLLEKVKTKEYEIHPPEKGEKITSIKKGDLEFSFDLTKEPYLIIPLHGYNKSIVTQFLTELYSKQIVIKS